MKYKSKNYWLMKSEAEMFSIDDFKKEKTTIWTEVRNYQARNTMRDLMSLGDYFLFYHSSSDPSGVFGVGRIASTGIGDPTALDKKSHYFDPKATKDNNPWVTVEVEFIEKFSRGISLEELKQNEKLSKMLVLQKGSRLSVQPVRPEEFQEILRMAS
jgi:predicted RNA-binding protein with PUA-like domain